MDLRRGGGLLATTSPAAAQGLGLPCLLRCCLVHWAGRLLPDAFHPSPARVPAARVSPACSAARCVLAGGHHACALPPHAASITISSERVDGCVLWLCPDVREAVREGLSLFMRSAASGG